MTAAWMSVPGLRRACRAVYMFVFHDIRHKTSLNIIKLLAGHLSITEFDILTHGASNATPPVPPRDVQTATNSEYEFSV